MEPQGETYLYRAFGLNVRSEIGFPELPEASAPESDMEIRLSQHPTSAWPDTPGNAWKFDMAAFRLRLEGIAEYEVTRGIRILVRPSRNADPALVRIHLLTVCMAALLMQRGRILLHASGIVHRGRALLFAGDSGMGKSSIAAELRRRGHRFLTDDTCVIESPRGESSSHLAYPSYPMLKLTAEALDRIGDPRYDRSLRLWPGTDKFGQILREEPLPHGTEIKGIYILGYAEADGPDASTERLLGNEAFLALSRHIYRREFIHESALQQAHFKTIGSLADGVPIWMAARRRDTELADFCDRIEAWIRRDGSL